MRRDGLPAPEPVAGSSRQGAVQLGPPPHPSFLTPDDLAGLMTDSPGIQPSTIKEFA
ncbi:hypothetical protein TPA0910_73900 [Streptomyces hygroscopicus subsp. sporocinereus]|uniref:Uncharacterized protein n=1 Tax=Streptomyces hygroscopicus TaxID=1912 RepID=A0ABQ3UBG8_STRHY|nr:hypothetical protein TPA0910_73900 [Streptomyces hygroscopicus]